MTELTKDTGLSANNQHALSCVMNQNSLHKHS